MKSTAKKVSATAMAAHLGLSRPYLDRIVADGTLSKDATGKFDVDETRLRYLRSLRAARRSSPATEAQAQYQRAKARRLELENGRMERRLIEVADCFVTLDQFVGLVLTELSSLPARLAGHNLGGRRSVEKEIFDLRERLSKAAAEKAATWRENDDA